MDLMTHNHGSMPGNTPPWAFLDSMDVEKIEDDDCRKQAKTFNEKCRTALDKSKRKDGKGFAAYQLKKELCVDDDCKEARKCIVTSQSVGCCDGKEAHHVVPAHCFGKPGARKAKASVRKSMMYPDCENYKARRAPCICLDGKDEGKKREHAKVHKILDESEELIGKENNHSWLFKQANKEGCLAISKVTGCPQKCLEEQSKQMHEDMGIKSDTLLRADSKGKVNEEFIPTIQRSVRRK